MKEINTTGKQDMFLSFLYGHRLTRLMLKPLVSPVISRLGGMILDSKLSCVAIRPFIKKII